MSTLLLILGRLILAGGAGLILYQAGFRAVKKSWPPMDLAGLLGPAVLSGPAAALDWEPATQAARFLEQAPLAALLLGLGLFLYLLPVAFYLVWHKKPAQWREGQEKKWEN